VLILAACECGTATPPPTTTTPTPAPTPAEGLTIHFIDVGQGDAILIDLGETEVLIDGGGKSSDVITYLNNHVDGALEVMIATHPHDNHIGGLVAVLGAFEVREIWHNNDISSSQTYAEFMAAVYAEGAEVRVGSRGKEIYVDKLTFTILNPTSLTGSTNDNSIVLTLSYGEVDFLFTGDAEYAAELSMLAAGIVPDVEVLKMGHHGSLTSSTPPFLALVRPEIAIYMAAERNSHGIPNEKTITTLTQVGAEIYGTDIYGTIIITTDGEPNNILIEAAIPVLTHTPTATIVSERNRQRPN
jgi:beta-lactamase superfamily II metal-dependent hydrolase